MSEDQQVESRNPLGVSPKDEDPKGFCKVVIVVPELRTKHGFSKGRFMKKPSDGPCKPVFEQRSFSLSVDCKTAQKKTVRYSFGVKKLPDEIIPEQCSVKFEDKKITILLKKLSDRSWDMELSSNGIEQYEEEEGTDEITDQPSASKGKPQHEIEAGQGEGQVDLP